MKTTTGNRMRTAWLAVMLLGLAGCSSTGMAPVDERSPAHRAAKVEGTRPVTPQIAPSTNGLHTVARGDTLYAIAFANGLDYREIAIWNQLESPDRILVGQVLRLTPPAGCGRDQAARRRAGAERPPAGRSRPYCANRRRSCWSIQKPTGRRCQVRDPVTASGVHRAGSVRRLRHRRLPRQRKRNPPWRNPRRARQSTTWLWPVDGKVIGRFGAAGGKGIDIAGPRNTPVRAVASGKVVYSGSGLRGYGQLADHQACRRIPLGLCAQRNHPGQGRRHGDVPDRRLP